MELNSEILKLRVIIQDLRTQLDGANYAKAVLAADMKMREVQLSLARTDANAMEQRLKELGEPTQNWRHRATVTEDGKVTFTATKVPVKCASPSPTTAAVGKTAPTAE